MYEGDICPIDVVRSGNCVRHSGDNDGDFQKRNQDMFD